MDGKKGPLSGLIGDTLSGLSDGGQKPTNNVVNSDENMNEVVMNASKSNEGNVDRKNGGSINADESIKWFSELNNNDVGIGGGKGASLSEMYNAGFPVPPGFVVTAKAFDYFMKKTGIKDKISEILSNVDIEDTEGLTNTSKEIRELIESKDIPSEISDEIIDSYNILSSEKIEEKGVNQDALTILKNSFEPIFVSVRSSATTEDLADASFAGQQESFLNIKGRDSLILHVKRCFSSLYTPRAIYYRKKKGFSEGEALLAVVVQKMVDSEKSGVAFSKNPLKNDGGIAIEAVFGLGEGIVSGRIKPDHYIVSEDLKIESVDVADKKIAIVRSASGENGIAKLNSERSNQQVLTNGEILEVANYALKLEDHYKKPQDIEFAVEMSKVYIVQSRPITTLKNISGGGKKLEGNVILKGLGASPGVGVGVVRIINSMEELVKIKKGEVLVTEMTNPDMVVGMQKSVAIVTDEGGMTSHAAIVSREMGIPAIVGTKEATKILKDGMKITVDGFNGVVYEGQVGETTLAEVKGAVETQSINVKVIVDIPDYAERAALSGVKSVGLMRLEGVIASSNRHPLDYESSGELDKYTGLLVEGIGKIAKKFDKIWIRASDIRTDEYSSLKGSLEREINPMLGFHGVRFSLKHPEILRSELLAVKNVADGNPGKKFGVMFPQIISIEEVKECKKYFDEIKADNMKFGVMIETPASVQIIEDICKEVDFVSFGTNDLTQYTLAVDRGEDNVQYLYNELHPAIFSQIKKVIEVCKKNDVETSICGQAGSKKEMVEFLFENGIDSVSVNADAAYEVSSLIKELEDNKPSVEKIAREDINNNVERKSSEDIEESPDNYNDRKVEIESVDLRENHNLKVVEDKKDGGENEDEEEGKRLRKKKKWEKFKKWKEKKRRLREEKRKQKVVGDVENGGEKMEDEGRNGADGNGWGKKGAVDLEISKDSPADKGDKDESNSKLLGDNIEVEAEMSNVKEDKVEKESVREENRIEDGDKINPIDDLGDIEEHAEDIEDEVERDHEKEIEDKERIEDRIETNVEKVENEGVGKVGGNEVGEIESEDKQGDKFEDEDDSKSSDFEEIGVYKPEEDDKEDKKEDKYNYNFEGYD